MEDLKAYNVHQSILTLLVTVLNFSPADVGSFDMDEVAKAIQPGLMKFAKLPLSGAPWCNTVASISDLLGRQPQVIRLMAKDNGLAPIVKLH